MPSESKSQRHLMGMVHAVQEGKEKAPSEKVKEMAKEMKPKDTEDFAKTKETGLPEHVEEKAASFLPYAFLKGYLKK